ncbi:MAG: hypothetical protein C4528_03280 [Gammaproteobacteria bacterium]|nr:MAG: hypothetical protein C4528_03280 [Gammaproteobacteria bacterium]
MVVLHESIGVHEPQAEADRRRLLAAYALVLLIIGWTKLVSWFAIGPMMALLPLCAGFVILVYLAPPIAAALFFLGNYFFGNLSMAFYPNISFLTVITAVLVCALLFVRWKRGELACFLNLPRRVWLAIAALALFFLIGYLRALWQVQMLEIDPEHSRSVFSLFQTSLRGNNEQGHYMFIGHWLSFIAIGALACLARGELKIFFASFSVLFVVQLLSIPFSYYPEFFRAIYVECQAMGLGHFQVNRGYLGYMAALASGLSLTMAHERKKLLRVLFLAWWMVLSVVVFLSATKGPFFAWILATAFVFWRGRRIEKLPYMTLACLAVMVGALSTISGYSVVPCGTVKKVVEQRNSIATRIASVQDLLAPYLGLRISEEVRLRTGETHRSTRAEDIVRYQAGETLPRSPSEYMRAKGGETGGLHDWLVGKGFGGVTRSIDYESGRVYTHAGSLNLFVDLFIETGFIGLSLFVFSIAVLWFNFRTTVASMTPDKGHLLLLGMSSMLLVLLVRENIAAETNTEDVVALMIGLLISAACAFIRCNR